MHEKSVSAYVVLEAFRLQSKIAATKTGTV
jgi:hypothetical protein